MLTLSSLAARLRAPFAPTRPIAPVAIPVVSRWFTWLLGIGILAFGGGSPTSQALRWLLIAATLAGLIVFTLVACRLFGNGWPRNRRAVAVVAALDLGLSLLVVSIEGGWSSAFYELAMTGVMMPAMVFGVLGAVLASAGFSLGFLWILVSNPATGGSLNFQVAALLNPWIVAGVVAVLGDLLRRLERSQARNLELAASEERWRIAREIHDGVAQQSYVLSIGLETAGEQVRRGDLEGLRRGLPALEKLAREALLEVRQYVAEGRPLIVGRRSIGDALRGLAREFSTISRVDVEVEAPDGDLGLSAAQQNALYRLAQESLANVFKHAEARHAWLNLRPEADRIVLEVADDGRGFEPGSIGNGFGLEGMRRRASELGGTFEVAPRSEGGTCLRACIPRG